MKLRNKKTGGIDDYEFVAPKEKGTIRLTNGKSPVEDIWEFDSLAELFKYFEDYEPKEPLIKDEKIRKAVRAWAEVNSIERVLYGARLYKSSCLLTDMGDDKHGIEFVGWIPTLKDDDTYTIAELCGEEEE